MSEENQSEQSQAGQPSAEQKTEVPKPESLPKDQEWDHVEFDEKTQRRFNRVYAEMKSTKDLVARMGQDNRALLDKIEEMESNQAKKSTDDQVANLIQQEKVALEEQDYERASRVRDQITDIKVEAKIPKEKPKPEPTEEEQYESWLTPDRAKALNDFANAKNEKGELLHPWADADHPDYETAIAAAQVVVQQNLDSPIEDILDKIAKVNDRVITKRSTAAVLGSSGDGPKPAKKVSITEDEKKIAAAMGLTPERYVAAKEKYA